MKLETCYIRTSYEYDLTYSTCYDVVVARWSLDVRGAHLPIYSHQYANV